MKLVTRLAGLMIVGVGQSCINTGSYPLWPEPDANSSHWSLFVRPAEARASGADDDDLVRELPVCVASQKSFAGELGKSVLYQFKRVGHELHVGYFVYW